MTTRQLYAVLDFAARLHYVCDAAYLMGDNRSAALAAEMVEEMDGLESAIQDSQEDDRNAEFEFAEANRHDGEYAGY